MKCLCGVNKYKREWVRMNIDIVEARFYPKFDGKVDVPCKFVQIKYLYACPECGTIKIEIDRDKGKQK